MAKFTSEWEWQTVNRALDTNVVGSTTFTRNNWTLVRFRYSDDTFDSELGDVETTSLSAENGGVTETISASSIVTYEYGFFSGSGNWASTSDIWEPTGFVVNGQPSYVKASGASTPDATKKNVLFLASSFPVNQWACSGDDTIASVDAGTWNTTASSLTNYCATATPGTGPYKSYTGSGTFSGTMTWSRRVAAGGGFTCTSDNQVYDSRSVDWYKQVQTWTFKDGWQ